MKYLLVWPLANLLRARWISGVTVGGVALAAFVVATLQGFVQGYEAAVAREVDGLGYDLLVTARGCPYEAATLMLRGGVGLRYMPAGVVASLEGDPAVAGAWPTLIHPVRDPDNPEGMTLLKGVVPGFLGARGLALRAGAWLDGETPGVVLGFEAAELMQRHPGDQVLLPRGEDPVTLPVLGILERTGSQLDGSVLVDLERLQEAFGLGDKLTGVGVQLSEAGRLDAQAVRDRYEADAALQVIPLSSVVETLRAAMANLRGVVRLLSGFLVGLAGVVLVNTALVRALSEHRGRVMLHAFGFSDGFRGLAALVVNLVLVGLGAALGVGAAWGGAGLSTDWIVNSLPYAPGGVLVVLDCSLMCRGVVGAAALGVLATVPALVRLRWGGSLADLRGN